jgi:hypothetical protein
MLVPPAVLLHNRCGENMMQRKVWLAAFASFTTACVGFWGYSVTQDRAAALRDIERQTATTARLLEEQAERAFEAGEHLLSMLAEIGRPQALRQPDAGQRAFERVRAAAQRSPQIGSAWILSAQGENLLDSWSWPPRPSGGARRGYFRAHQEGWQGLFIGPPESGSVTGTDRFTMSRPCSTSKASSRPSPWSACTPITSRSSIGRQGSFPGPRSAC